MVVALFDRFRVVDFAQFTLAQSQAIIEAIFATAIIQGDIDFSQDRSYGRVVNPGFEQWSLAIGILLEANSYAVANEILKFLVKTYKQAKVGRYFAFLVIIYVC
jgi:hypothetical protein